MADPDISLLAQQEEEPFEDDLTDLKNPQVAAEISEDPVRLYLRDIGKVKLLDADSEFRLATMIEANRLVGVLRRRPHPKDLSTTCAIYHAVISEMSTSWERLVEDAERLHHDPPDFGMMLGEAQALHAGWQSDAPSYLRAFLDNGMWGTDELWDEFARKAYSVFLSLYLFPLKYAEWLLKHVNQNHQLPNQRTLYRHLCEDEDLIEEMSCRAGPRRGSQSVADSRQPASGGQRCQALSGTRHFIPGSDPGRQHGPLAGGGQVRPAPRFQVQHLCHLVDTTVHQPFHRGTGTHHSHPGTSL